MTMKKIVLLSTLLSLTIAALARMTSPCAIHRRLKSLPCLLQTRSLMQPMQSQERTFIFSEEGGKMIQFSCPDGKNANGYLIMATKKDQQLDLCFSGMVGIE